MFITRTTNDNGTYRYEIDGELHTKASKVLYTHVSTWTVGGPEFVTFHKSQAAADKAPGSPRNGWVKTGVIAIQVKAPEGYSTTPPHIDGDPAPEATPEAPAETETEAPAVNVNDRVVIAGGHYEGTVLEVQAGGTHSESARVQWDRTGSTTWHSADRLTVIGHEAPEAPAAPEATPVRSQDYCPRCSRLVTLRADGTFYAHGPRANRCPASGQATSQAPADAAPKALAKGTDVRVNDSYQGAYEGRTGKVDSTNRGDDGNLYTLVDFGGFTWPFQAHELDVITDDEAPQTPAEDAEEVTAEEIEFAREVTRATFATPVKTPVQRSEEIRTGDDVEYLHTGTGAWTPAVVLSFRASDNAVLLKREDGTTDAAPAGNVRRPTTQRLYAVEANSSGVAFPMRSTTMREAIRAMHTQTRHPVIVDGLTPDSGYTSNVDPEGTHHFIVDGVNAYAVRELSPEEAEENAHRATAPAPGWEARRVEEIRKGDRVAFHHTSEGRRVLSAGVTGEAMVITYDEAGAPTITKPVGTGVFIKRRSEAEVMARATGSRGATVVQERRNADGSLTEISRESWGEVDQPPTRATRKAHNDAWRAVVEARQAWRDYPGTRVITGADGRPAIHPRALPLATALAVAEAALDAARQG